MQILGQLEAGDTCREVDVEEVEEVEEVAVVVQGIQVKRHVVQATEVAHQELGELILIVTQVVLEDGKCG